MKKRILAITFILIVLCSMFPMQVFAGSTTLKSCSEVEWVKSEINGNVYRMSYYHPKGLDKFYIFKSNYLFRIVFYNDKETTISSDYSHATGHVIQFIIGRGLPARTDEETLAICRDVLYNDESEWRKSTNTSDATKNKNPIIHDITNETEDSIVGGYYSPQNFGEQHKDLNIANDFLSMEECYAEWYFNENGTFPPFATTDDMEEIEYMIGNKYVILQQEVENTGHGGAGANREEGMYEHSIRGKVDTVDDVLVNSQDGKYVYVVISSNNDKGDITNWTWDEFWKVDGTFVDLALRFNIEGTGKRNGYDYKKHEHGYIFWNKEENLNRYYFKSKADAAKFVLYGTAGAKYDHKEIGKTDYGYGYTDVCWNNYEIRYYGTNPVPAEQYPLERGRIILRWHEENVYEREYLMIDYNYFPLAIGVDTTQRLLISEKLKPTYKNTFCIDEVNSDTFNKTDLSQYKETSKYDGVAMQSFYIYTKELEEKYISNSWDVIYTTHSIFRMKINPDGSFGYDLNEEPLIELLTDKTTGKDYTVNHSTKEMFAEDKEEPYIYDETTGKYEHKDGTEIDPNILTSGIKEWQDSLKDYVSTMQGAINIIDKFTDIIHYANTEIKPITSLLNDFLSGMPSPIKMSITFTVLAIILSRIIKRGQD